MKQTEENYEVREFFIKTQQQKQSNQPEVLRVSYLLVDPKHKFNDKRFDTDKTEELNKKLANYIALYPIQNCENIIMNNKKVGYFVDQLFVEA